jgi:hypothetical protein
MQLFNQVALVIEIFVADDFLFTTLAIRLV